MALHTGTAELRAGDYAGFALSRVARILAAGHGGQVLLSQAAHELVRNHLPPEAALRDLGTCRLKDLNLPERIFQLVAPGVPSEFPSLRTADTRLHNLPAQPTALIGREREIAEVTALLRHDDVRLLTLTGPGGTGKTRLALQAAAELALTPQPPLPSRRERGSRGSDAGEGLFPDGIFFVNLAPIGDPNLVATTIAHTLGVVEVAARPIEEGLRTFLRTKRMLLLLDNFEQVLDAAPLIADLLAAAPGLKVLVTSRATLHLYGEHEFGVPPLALPPLRDDRRPTTDDTHDGVVGGRWSVVGQYESVRLFIARAQAAKADFTVTNENAPAVAEICHRLDGLPLAIELAAARIKLFAPEALLARLSNRLQVLTGGPRDLPERQQTLRNTIDWSYNLLSEDEQALFRRLGVFVGGCTLAAAAAVLSSEFKVSSSDQPNSELKTQNSKLDILDGLAALMDKSLLRQEEGADGEPRFVMLETVREYALEHLGDSGEEAALRWRHAMYYLAATIEAGPTGEAREKDATERGLASEIDNLRMALRFAIDQREAELALQISTALFRLPFQQTVQLSEGRAWVEAALAIHDAENASPATSAIRIKALDEAGWAAYNMGEYDRAQAHFVTLLAMCKDLGDWANMALAQRSLGWLALQRGNLMDARNWLEQSLALCQETYASEGIAWSLYDLGHLAFVQGELEQAEQSLTGSLALFRNQGNVPGVIRACLSLGHVARAHGQLAQATAWYRESITHQPDCDRIAIASPMEGLAGVLGAQGRGTHAARLFGAAATLRGIDASLEPIDRAGYERDIAAIRAQLDDATFAAAWAEGQQMTLEQAIAEALGG